MALTIVGLGDARSAAPHVINALKSCSIVYLQTDRYAAFNQIREEGKGEYLDPLYESCENFEAFNRAVCERVLKFAKEGDAALCVAGDGVYDNAAACAVVKAAKEGGIKVRILPGASLATAALGKAASCRKTATASPLTSTKKNSRWAAVNASSSLRSTI
ncbi:MAG: hypothetical protein E7328_02365 [Clostridiales bacterium]|nr:hypothetical protein [Clostridiales bacterium]